jgi:Rubisco Assembly chaperone C-terminal domain
LQLCALTELGHFASTCVCLQENNNPMKNRGQGLIVVDAGTTHVEDGKYYLADVDGRAQLVSASDVTTGVLATVLLVVMPPRPKGQTPMEADV